MSLLLTKSDTCQKSFYVIHRKEENISTIRIDLSLNSNFTFELCSSRFLLTDSIRSVLMIVVKWNYLTKIFSTNFFFVFCF